MTDPRANILAEITEHLSLAAQHSARATTLLTMLHDQAPALGPVPTSLPQSSAGGAILSANPRSLTVWAEWLAEHGPALRQDVWDGTGINLSTGAMKNVLAWKAPMVMWDDTAVMSDTVCRVQGLTEGRGRPPTVYFLWSQRWDVFSLFGVGPSDRRTETEPTFDWSDPEPADGWITNQSERESALSEPTNSNEPEPMDEPESTSISYATMADWDAAWAETFDSLVATESKPSPELKASMVETVPEGADSNAALAIAYRNAVLRSRSPQAMTGVIAPPESNLG